MFNCNCEPVRNIPFHELCDEELNTLKGCPTSALKYAYLRRERIPFCEKIVIRSISCAYNYAVHVVKGRFEQGENIISSNAEYSFKYAMNVLKGRFPLAEELILKSTYIDQYLYLMLSFSKKRSFELEKNIFHLVPSYFIDYLHNYLHERDDQIESLFKENFKNPDVSLLFYRYCVLIAKKPIPEMEYLLSSAEACYKYAMNVLEGRFEKTEDIIASDPKYSYKYAMNVLKGRFEKGESSILKYDLKYIQRYFLNCNCRMPLLENNEYFGLIEYEVFHDYILKHIGCRLPVYEDWLMILDLNVANNIHRFMNYVLKVLKRRFYEIEPFIMTHEKLANLYVASFIHKNERIMEHEMYISGKINPVYNYKVMPKYLSNNASFTYCQQTKDRIVGLEYLNFFSEMDIVNIYNYSKAVNQTFPHYFNRNYILPSHAKYFKLKYKLGSLPPTTPFGN